MAAQAPAKAIKQLMPKSPIRSDPEAMQQLHSKCASTSHVDLSPPEGTKKPAWLSCSLILATAASSLARLAAPGHDGWTRELLLASICSSNAAAFELLVNTIARGEPILPTNSHIDPTKSARIAMWCKDPAQPKGKVRIVGMTSTVSKLTWRALLATDTTKFKEQAMMAPGGVHSVTRWTQAALERGLSAYTADVVDAYWGVRRAKVLDWMIQHGHPATWIFWRSYGKPALLEVRGQLTQQSIGVLPGCGGASIAFAIDMHTIVDAIDVRLYADDATAINELEFRKFVASCTAAGKSLAKALCISPNAPANAKPVNVCGLDVEVVPAARVLGAMLGKLEPAVSLLRDRVASKLKVLDTIRDSEVTTQAKWQMTRSMERSITWDASANPTATFAEVSADIDAHMRKHFTACFLPSGCHLEHKSVELLHTPSAHGGLGMICFGTDAERIFDMTTAGIHGTPVAGSSTGAVAPLSLRTVRRQLADAKAQSSTNRDVRNGRFFDDTVAWFDIQHVTHSTTITDEAFKLGMANHVQAFFPPHCQYKACKLEDAGFDHSQRCHQCAGPYRYPRHQRIQQEFINAATSHGIIVTTNFYSIGAQPKEKRPDAIVFRGIAQKIPLVIDFACTHQPELASYNAMGLLETRKRRKYADYLSEKDGQRVEIVPFIMSSKALLSQRTAKEVDLMGKLATRKGFVYEVIRRTKVAIINFEPFRKHAIAMRHANGTLLPAQRPDSDDDTKDAAHGDDNDDEQDGVT